MANSIDALKPTYWSRRYQLQLRARNIARVITSTAEQASLYNGKTVDRPYLSRAVISDLTMGTGTYTASAITATSDTLTVNKWKASAIRMTKDEKIQVLREPQMVNTMIDDGAWRLNQYIDRTVLGQYSNAAYYTTASAYTKDTIYDGLGEAHRTLRSAGVEQSKPWFAVVDPYITQLIQNSQGGRETILGDKEQKMGFGFNREYAGFRVYESAQALTWTGNINIATNPTATDTVVIDGVTFTFVSTIGTTAGNVLIAGTAAGTVDNLVALINAPGTTTANGVALSAANQLKFTDASSIQLIAATDNTTSIGLVSIKGRITLTETFTDTTDNVSDMVLHCLVGQMGCIDTVFQSDIETTVKDVSGTLATDYVTDVLWGVKTFNEGANRMCDFRVTTASDSASS